MTADLPETVLLQPSCSSSAVASLSPGKSLKASQAAGEDAACENTDGLAERERAILGRGASLCKEQGEIHLIRRRRPGLLKRLVGAKLSRCRASSGNPHMRSAAATKVVCQLHHVLCRLEGLECILPGPSELRMPQGQLLAVKASLLRRIRLAPTRIVKVKPERSSHEQA